MPFSYHNGNPPIPQRTIDVAGFGKTAIITGCASGIGLATTQLFLSHQYQVLGIDISEMDYALIDPSHQERFHFHRADLTKEGGCDESVRICVAEYGEKIDVLANVAGLIDSGEAADICTDQEWDRVIAINLTVPTKMIRAVLPMMKAKKSGIIINVASKVGLYGAAAGVAYTASKHGILGITKNTACRFLKEGIRCNAILPEAVDTNTRASINKVTSGQDGYLHLAPIHGLHTVPTQKPTVRAVDVANLILFLTSDQASMINGVSLPIGQAWTTI